MRRGLGHVQVIAILAAAVVLASLFTVTSSKARRTARVVRDASQVLEIHLAWLAFSNELGGSLPLPGLAASRAAGTGAAEDHSLNHTANIYSMGLVADYYPPELLVSPLEVADHVRVHDPDPGAYDPVAGVSWDPTFVMHIEDPRIGANASYAHLIPVGDRRRRWIAAANAFVPILGTRGVRGGAGPGNAEHDRSPALRLLGDGRTWAGHLVFGDHHLETWEGAFTSPGLTFDDGSGPRPDNVFAAGFIHPDGPQAAADVFLSICVSAGRSSAQDVYDPLE